MIDRRLSHLPDDLQAIAQEFVLLHSAWETDFRAELCEYEGVEPMLFLKWGNMDHNQQQAVFSFFPAVPKDVWATQRSTGTLRRSRDFEAFIRRFTRPDPETYAEKWARLAPFILADKCKPCAPVTWCTFELLHLHGIAHEGVYLQATAYGFFHLPNYDKQFAMIDVSESGEVRGEVLATLEPGEWMKRMARFGLEGMNAFSDLLNGEPR